MANSFVVADWVAMEALRLLTNKLEVAQFFDTSYNKEFTQSFAVGDTVRIKLPQQWTVSNTVGYTPQAIDRKYTTVTVDQFFQIGFDYDSVEQALKLERSQAEVSKQYIEPAIAQMKQEIDSRAALFGYQHANNIVGVLGTDPTSTSTVMAARQLLIEKACPPSGDKGFIIPPSVNTAIVPAISSLFNPSSEISREFREGSIGKLNGFDWYESMSLYTHTAGTWAGAVSIATTATDGATTLDLTCTTGDTFKAGDKIGIATVYPVNPMTRRVTSTAKTMTVTVLADVTGASSAATISISPALYGPGSQYQNVDRLPTAADVCTLFPGTASPNGKVGKVGLAIHPDAFAIVGVKLDMPKQIEAGSQQRDPETGIAIRFTKTWDPLLSRMITRFDCLMGFGPLRPDNACVAVLCGA